MPTLLREIAFKGSWIWSSATGTRCRDRRRVPRFIGCRDGSTDSPVRLRDHHDVLGAEPSLVNTADGYAPRPPYRPLTKFEQRGLRLGHGVRDLVFTRRAA